MLAHPSPDCSSFFVAAYRDFGVNADVMSLNSPDPKAIGALAPAQPLRTPPRFTDGLHRFRAGERATAAHPSCLGRAEGAARHVPR